MANDTAVLPKRVKKPDWLRVKLPVGKKYTELRGLVDKYKLNTICTSGSCPNMREFVHEFPEPCTVGLHYHQKLDQKVP